MWGIHAGIISGKQQVCEERFDKQNGGSDGGYDDGMVEPAPVPLLLSDKEVDQLFWQQNTEALLFAQDQTAWGAGVLFLCFVITVMDFDPAFIICGMQMLTQLVWMRKYPASYKSNRDIVCLAIRIWRAYVTFRLCTNFAGKVGVAKPLLRSLLVASGALVNFVVSFGYQLKFTVHVKVQAMAVAISIVSGTKSVAAFVTREEHLPTITRIYDSFSTLSSTLLEGINFPGHRRLGCAPDPGLALVLMAQLYLGFLAPTYLLYVLERTSRHRFKSRLLAAPPAPSSLDACCMAIFTAVTHVLILAVAAAVLWEAICCSCWALTQPSPTHHHLHPLGALSSALAPAAQQPNSTS